MVERPSPEKLLKRAHEEETQEKRGKLKIYLGAAPGVGKTYTMLEDALAKRKQGLDVVIGVAESHGRAEIEALLSNFEILPKQTIDYRDRKLLEFDLDGALKRNPALILIDEMAHTNAPNARHKKRWQDIKEVLDRGINVYTTLNVQHIESRADIVTQITHIPIKETVPDSMLEIADTIELVDLPPEDLLKRLQEGKVYFPKTADLAREHFFQEGNLITLRELSLRVAAELVGSKVLLYRHGQGVQDIWPTKEKILVCVGPGAESIKLIRTAKRIATNLQSEWIAIHVNSSRQRLSLKQRNDANHNLHLAEQLGAETHILTGSDIAKEIINFARDQNITQIIIWKRIRSRLRDLFTRNLADEIVRKSDEIDVHVITGESIGTKPQIIPFIKPVWSWRIYGVTLGIVALMTAIDFLLFPYLHASNLIMIYLLGVTIVAIFGQLGPSIFASILSVLAYDFFFIPPFFTFAITDLQYLLTLIIMLIVSQTISHLTILTRRQAETARKVEYQSIALYKLRLQLTSVRGVDKLLDASTSYLAEVFDCEAWVLMPKNNHLVISGKYEKEQELTLKEQSVAQWVYDIGQEAGLGTDTLPNSEALYLPLLGSKGPIGALRLKPHKPEQLFTPEQMHLLEASVNQIALALETDQLHEQDRKSELSIEVNRSRTALLQSLSHDLRSPLVAAMGAASTLVEIDPEHDADKIKKLGNDIAVELEQLDRLINNFLLFTYLESGSLILQKQLLSLEDTINLVIRTLNKKIGNRTIHIQITKNLPKIYFDKTLIQEVFRHLLDNAIKFSSAEKPIGISVRMENEKVIVGVKDRGPGIVPDEVNRLFEKFYRGRMLTTERGLGLGLAICHSIIKAHDGDIWAENREEGGAIFHFTLPIK